MTDLPRSLKHVTVWLLVITAGFLATQLWLRHRDRPRIMVTEGQVELRRHPDGHFYWPGTVQGREVLFLIDTGASYTALPRALVEDLGLEPHGRMNFNTANGEVWAPVSRTDLVLQGGFEVRSTTVSSMEGLAHPLLGMSVLGALSLSQEDGVLRIRPGRQTRQLKRSELSPP
jgi:aspartyl protease family protein